jgi:CheY-like chemotaxis protein
LAPAQWIGTEGGRDRTRIAKSLIEPLSAPANILTRSSLRAGETIMALDSTLARDSSQSHPPSTINQILVVEDHLDSRQAVCRILQMSGNSVVAVATLAEARAALDGPGGTGNRDIQLVMTDLELPDGDAEPLIRQTAESGVPCIVVSGHESSEDQARSCAAGASEFIVKPLTFEILTDVVQRYCHKDRRPLEGTR